MKSSIDPSSAMTLAVLLGIMFISSASLRVSVNLTNYSPQAGAWGDDSSQHNLGVRAEIRTNIYNADNGTFDYFWVGDNLANGAFIQFGYAYEPGNYCLKMHEVNNTGNCDDKIEHISKNDARWQWQYWPNGSLNDFFYGIGSANSVGENGTWHTYAVVPDGDGWSFVLDNQHVGNISAKPVQSRDPVYVVVEESTNSTHFGELGPVEFRNVAYLQGGGWHMVDSLTSLHGCASLSDCSVENPFGAVAIGPNHIIAGSHVETVENQKLLWTDEYVTLDVNQAPNAEVAVTVLGNTTVFHGSFSIKVPKGMFVYIQLNHDVVRPVGPLFLLGASSDFQRWTGNVNSTNRFISILMDGNKEITGSWTTDYSTPLLTISFLSLLIASLVILKLPRGRRNVAIARGSPLLV